MYYPSEKKSNNINSPNNLHKKKASVYQNSFLYSQPLKQKNSPAKKQDVYVNENLYNKRKRGDDPRLKKAELAEARTLEMVDTLKAQVAHESLKNCALERRLQEALENNELLEKYNTQLAHENKYQEEISRKLSNKVIRLQKENDHLNHKVEYSLCVYDNYNQDDVFTVEDITEVNPEYNRNFTLFKPEQKCNSASSIDIFDIYCT